MASFNKVVVVGNLTKDVEVRKLEDGKSIASLSVAVNNRFGKKEDTIFFDVPVYENVAENCAKYIGKGSSVLVDGYLYTREWENKDGKTVTSICIGGARVTFLDSGNKGETPEKKTKKEETSSEENIAQSQDIDEDVLEDDDMPF